MLSICMALVLVEERQRSCLGLSWVLFPKIVSYECLGLVWETNNYLPVWSLSRPTFCNATSVLTLIGAITASYFIAGV